MRLIWSGLLALIVQFSLCVLLVVAFLPKTQEKYIFNDKTQIEYFEVRIQEDKTKNPKKPKAPKSESQEQIVASAPTPSVKTAPVAGADVKKMFEKIDSPEPPVREEVVQDERPTFTANSIQTQDYTYNEQLDQQNDENKKIQSQLEEMWEKELEISPPPPQDTADGVYNEWFAEIKKRIDEKWKNNFYEPALLTAVITIDRNGKFSYKIIKYSHNQSYNAHIQSVLEGLSLESFPPYPDGQIKVITVDFRNKGSQ
ncbi:TonB C-terminal domain-containing protein [Helicobacter enhydrae]|nr:TonB C-terminal domain-containing protein [Helicobacter enhydrae]